MSDDLINIIQREIGRALERRVHHKTGLVTSYDPKTHSVKVKYQPDGTESGWIPIKTHAAGSVVSHVVGPTPGDGKKTGDQAVIGFLNGDMESPFISGYLHSDVDPPPKVESGETMIMHHKTKVWQLIDKKGKVTHQGNKKGIFVQTADNGEVTIKTPDKGTINIDAAKGTINAKGKSVKVKGDKVNVDGKPVIVSKLQADGTVTATGPAAAPSASGLDGEGSGGGEALPLGGSSSPEGGAGV